MNQMPISWQYIAGFFDGEGCVSHHQKIQGKKGDKDYYIITLSQKQTDVLEQIRRFMGFGKIYRGARCSSLAIKAHQELVTFAKEVIPFSVVKQQKLQECLQCTENKMRNFKALRKLWNVDKGKIALQHAQGVSLAKLASQYGVTCGTITYHIRQHKKMSSPEKDM